MVRAGPRLPLKKKKEMMTMISPVLFHNVEFLLMLMIVLTMILMMLMLMKMVLVRSRSRRMRLVIYLLSTLITSMQKTISSRRRWT
jgi:hypothetical protein